MKNIFRKVNLVLCFLCLLLLVGCKKDEPKDPVKLSQPENVLVSEDYVLTWNAVTNASGYAIRIGAFVENVTGTSFDLNTVLVEGSNYVFVEALGDDKNYLDSDATFVAVEYTKYTPAKFKEAVEKVFIDNEVTVSDEEVESTIELLENALKGTQLSRDEALVVLDFVVAFTSAPLFDNSMAALGEFRDVDIESADLAEYFYNLLNEYLFKEQQNGNQEATMLIYVLSGNKAVLVDTMEALYLYSTEFGAQYTTAINKFDVSDRTDTDKYALYRDLVEALFNEKRPTEDDVKEITSSIKYALGMFESSDFGSEELQVITDILNLIESTYEPIINASHKVLTVVTVQQFALIYDSVQVLLDAQETGLTWENRHAVELAVKDLVAVLARIEVDIEAEKAEIEAAWAIFENSSALPYLESLLNDILESVDGGSEIISLIESLLNFNPDDSSSISIVKSFLEVIQVPAELETIINEIISIIEAYEEVPTTENELINSILDKLTNDESIQQEIKDSGYEELINDIVDVLRTYDGGDVTVDEIRNSVIDTIFADESLKEDIKDEIDANLTADDKVALKEDIDTAIVNLDQVLTDEVVSVEEILTVIDTVTEMDVKLLFQNQTDIDLDAEVAIDQVELIYDLLVYYQGILAN